MRLILAIAALAALTTPVFAQRRPSTTNMACAQAANLVARAGAVVLSTGPNTYDRFVRSENLCPTGLFARPAFAPTRDNPQCGIGYYCTSAPPFFGR